MAGSFGGFASGMTGAWRGLLRLAACLCAALVLPGAAVAAPSWGSISGELQYIRIKDGDTLLDLAREHNLGFVELRAANQGVDAWTPKAGSEIVLPTAHILPDAPRRGVVINLADFRLYYFPADGSAPYSYPIGIGRDGMEVPLGTTSIVLKRRNPTWIPTPTARDNNPALPKSVPPGPNNPLGHRAMNLGWQYYVIHGTSKPDGIGRRVSSGCFRLYPEDIEALFDLAAVGMPVRVVNKPVKIGYKDGNVYLEVHPDPDLAEIVELTGEVPPAEPADIRDRLTRAAGRQADRIDWRLVNRILTERRGIPVRVTW